MGPPTDQVFREGESKERRKEKLPGLSREQTPWILAWGYEKEDVSDSGGLRVLSQAVGGQGKGGGPKWGGAGAQVSWT